MKRSFSQTPELSLRSQLILKLIVESFVETGEPVGSKAVSRLLGMELSSATIRNVMMELEERGYIYSPHTSAGRLPTERGLRLFVNGLLEISDLSEGDRAKIQKQYEIKTPQMEYVLEHTSDILSGLTQYAGLVLAPKYDKPLKHIEFVAVDHDKILVILVQEGGKVENRLIQIHQPVPSSVLVEATNYFNSRVVGKTLDQIGGEIKAELTSLQNQLHSFTRDVIEQSLTLLGQEPVESGHVYVRGRANLLNTIRDVDELRSMQIMMENLEVKKNLLDLLQHVVQADGVQIFIGAENELFQHSGWSMVLAPLHGNDRQTLGAIGIIGPSHMNYGRIVPMIDYTAKVVKTLLNL